MPFVHLANGDVHHLTGDELTDRYGDETPTVFRSEGKESAIIGIYPDDVEYVDENVETGEPETEPESVNENEERGETL